VLGRAKDVIITAEDAPADLVAAVRAGVATLCANAAARGITVHFKHRSTSWTPDVASTLNFVSSVGAANFKFAANTADASGNVESLLSQAGGQLGLILITTASRWFCGEFSRRCAASMSSRSSMPSIRRRISFIATFAPRGKTTGATTFERYAECLAAGNLLNHAHEQRQAVLQYSRHR